MAVKSCPPMISFSGMQFCPGHIERRFIEVPLGATWVRVTMRTSGFDTARRFFIDGLQLSPLKRPIKTERVVTFSSPSAQTFFFPVEGGRTIELAVAQFWSSGVGSHETTMVDFEVEFHGITVNNEEILLDGSEAPVRICIGGLLSSEKLVPSAILKKVRIPLRPVDTKLRTLATNRDKLPSGKQILALTLTWSIIINHDCILFNSYKFKLEDGAEIKPFIPLLNNRIYDTKFESQFYMISDSNKEAVRLGFYSEPDAHMIGNGSSISSTLIPGSKEAFYVGPPTKDRFPKNCPEGSVLVGAISYGKFSSRKEGRPDKSPVSYQISCLVPPNKVANLEAPFQLKAEEDKGKASSTTSSKSVAERLEEEVRDAKIKLLTNLKQNTDEERSEWKKLSLSLKAEYPKYTPLLAKILEGVLSQGDVKDKCQHLEEVIGAADEVIDSIDRDELAKYLSQKSVPDDEGEEKTKKQMETMRDQLAEALYQRGLALAEMESLKGERKVVEGAGDQVATPSDSGQDLFEATYKELRKWVDVKSSKYGTITVIRERRSGRLGSALKVLNDITQDEGEPPKKKLYELKLSLIEEIGWAHVASYEQQWMHVRFPPSLPLF
ncbi:hypothetical protein Cgig2_012495 [Carnegiea gigantea]|uniref:Tripeptidyl peptidase II Ig-like domain-containing protein n=1 Tax=Carnegiea gigantea TaxID=171969 RepID=A0A9Q1K6D1_9CARY|nr:hypothetical protein Cgig2_012495 [Carnegiea gigantea]